MASKSYGLRLTLGGAPATPHVVGDLPGHFRPDVPTPVGEGCPVSLDRAKKLDADEGCPLELVELTDPERSRKQAAQDADAARRNLRDAARVADGAESARVEDERKAVKKSTSNPKE